MRGDGGEEGDVSPTPSHVRKGGGKREGGLEPRHPRHPRHPDVRPPLVIFTGNGTQARAYEHKRRHGGSVYRWPGTGGYVLLIDEPSPDLRVALDRAAVRRRPKVGRNDPCPCGCGRKAKRCDST